MKVRLHTSLWLNICLLGLLIFITIAILVTPIRTNYRSVSTYIAGGGLIIHGIAKILFLVFTRKRGYEALDERDVQIQNKSANYAIRWSAYSLMVLLLLSKFLELLDSFEANKYILLVVIGIFLPDFYRDCFSLYFLKHGELE